MPLFQGHYLVSIIGYVWEYVYLYMVESGINTEIGKKKPKGCRYGHLIQTLELSLFIPNSWARTSYYQCTDCGIWNQHRKFEPLLISQGQHSSLTPMTIKCDHRSNRVIDLCESSLLWMFYNRLNPGVKLFCQGLQLSVFVPNSTTRSTVLSSLW